MTRHFTNLLQRITVPKTSPEIDVAGREPQVPATALSRSLGRDFGFGPLLLIVILALIPRIYWMMTQTPVISMEGSEYLRMAQNLAQGHGLAGNFEGPETMYTPLFSLLTAGLDLLIRNDELAAHLIALAFGTALIFPVFFIARLMYDSRVAYMSAVLVAFHPLLIALSASIYNENVYLPLLLSGVYFGMRALEFGRNKDYVLLSICLALAYLTRPEAFAYPVFFSFATWIGVLLRRISVRRAATASALIIGIFMLIASPYAAFLYAHTGHLRLEGKWNINYTIAKRIRSGLNSDEAAYGLAPDSRVAGPLLAPFQFAAYSPYPNSLVDKVQTLLAMAKRNRKVVSQSLLDNALGSPLFLGLVPLGLFRKGWSRRRLFHESIIICIGVSILFLFVTSSSAEFRYVFPLVGLGVLWVAKGVAELGQWSKSSISVLKISFLPKTRHVTLVAQSVLLFLAFAISLASTHGNVLFRSEQQENLDIKEAGLWLRNYRPGPKRIVCFATVPTYYAQGTLVGLPYAESSQALRYIDSENPDFIVLDAQYVGHFPEVAAWMANRIPDERAQLVYELGTDPSRKIQIYRWESRSPGHR